MRGVAVKTINQATTLRNWIIGCYIVEYEQNGSDRAKYGDNLLKSLEKRIGQKGLNVTLFQLSRLFYRDYPHIGTLVSAIMRRRCINCRYQKFMRQCRTNCRKLTLSLLIRKMQASFLNSSIHPLRIWFLHFPFRISGSCLR